MRTLSIEERQRLSAKIDPRFKFEGTAVPANREPEQPANSLKPRWSSGWCQVTLIAALFTAFCFGLRYAGINIFEIGFGG